MTAYQILVSSYTSSVTLLSFDPAAAAAADQVVKILAASEVGHHPSWVTRNPSDRSQVFTGLEQTDGRVVAVRVDGGQLSVQAEAQSGGADPASLLVLSGGQLLVGNYSGSTLGIFDTSPSEGLQAKEPNQIIHFEGSGPNQDRQERSHPHDVVWNASNEELLVPDLGADKTWRLTNTGGKWSIAGFVQYEPGSGPRHAVVRDGILYTVLELGCQLASHKLPALPAAPEFIASLPTLKEPPEVTDPQSPMLCAEVLFPPPSASFPRRLIYVSNRNDPHPEGDTIAVFETSSEGGLTLVAEIRTGLNHLRGMAFGGPDSRYLFAGGVHGGGVKVFERVEGGVGLREIAKLPLGSPTGFLWMD